MNKNYMTGTVEIYNKDNVELYLPYGNVDSYFLSTYPKPKKY